MQQFRQATTAHDNTGPHKHTAGHHKPAHKHAHVGARRAPTAPTKRNTATTPRKHAHPQGLGRGAGLRARAGVMTGCCAMCPTRVWTPNMKKTKRGPTHCEPPRVGGSKASGLAASAAAAAPPAKPPQPARPSNSHLLQPLPPAMPCAWRGSSRALHTPAPPAWNCLPKCLARPAACARSRGRDTLTSARWQARRAAMGRRRVARRIAEFKGICGDCAECRARAGQGALMCVKGEGRGGGGLRGCGARRRPRPLGQKGLLTGSGQHACARLPCPVWWCEHVWACGRGVAGVVVGANPVNSSPTCNSGVNRAVKWSNPRNQPSARLWAGGRAGRRAGPHAWGTTRPQNPSHAPHRPLF